MKVLHVLPYVPLPIHFGGALRMFHLLKALVRHHDVTVLAYGTEQNERDLFAALGPYLRSAIVFPHPWTRYHRRATQLYSLCTDHSFFYHLGYSDVMQNTLDRLLATEEFDVVQTEFSIMGSFELRTDALKILDEHNVEYDNFRRMARNGSKGVRSFFYGREYQKFYREEIAACGRYDALFVTSERDKELFDIDLPDKKKFIVPNGVDLDYFHPSTQEPDPCSIVFTGMMGYVPNYDGMLYFLDAVFPLILKEVPQAKVVIVGNKPPRVLRARSSSNVIVTGHVEDVRPYVWNSAVYVVPLRMGSGTRLKVLEALAMKKPIVTTSIGCEGIDVKHLQHVLIADEPKTFARSVIELLRNPGLRTRLTERGCELVRAQYSWERIGDLMEEAYGSLRREHPAPAFMETA